RVTLQRAAVDPSHDGGDLLVAQRTIVLEVLNSDRLDDVPRRHLTRLDAELDGGGPGTRLLIREQRHRRNRIGPVTRLTLVLEDGRDVLGEGDRAGRFFREDDRAGG